MTDVEPSATERGVAGSVAAELAMLGFEGAEEIGRGGFWIVYRCTQGALDRIVAVKLLTADLDEDNRERFFREQRATGRLTGHPNVVNILQVGATENGRPFIVMPYYPRGCLETHVRHNGPLSLEETLRLGVKIAGALETAHQAGVLHRDIKPANILLTDFGEPALSDFGIAHIAGGFITKSGIVTGTPAFTAPEVLAGEPASIASDVYGLGAMLFAAATGRVAYEPRSGEQLVAQFLRITAEPVPDPCEHGICDDLSTIIQDAMSGEAGRRPSAKVMGEQLQQCQLNHGYVVDEMALSTSGTERELKSLARSNPADSGKSRKQIPPPAWQATGRLPVELTSFIGRRNELTNAANSLASSRLVTLTGIGGVGKTRLAVRVAKSVLRDFPDGVTFVELGELHDESLLIGVVARALGLRDGYARPLEEALIEALSSKRLLLILDNCEQMLAAVAEFAGSLLRACAGLRILTTSREPIGLVGETVLPIAPFTVPDPEHLPRGLPRNDAMRLFTERAAAAIAGFELAEDNKVTIARICERLDGLPLPIELATARLRAMSPEQILQRLTDRFALLTRGSRSAPSRQQTLRMCIDWSFDLCSQVEQRVWGQLSVFAGGFELDAAQLVCGSEITAVELLDVVSDLVDKSILIREESGTVMRFRMLETVRAYGLDKVNESGNYPELRRRHRDWYEQLALAAEAEWLSPREVEWIVRLGRDLPNLRLAMEFCVSNSPDKGIRIASGIFPFWLSQGSLKEGRSWLGRLLSGYSGPATLSWAKAHFAACHLAGVEGDLDTMGDLVREGRAKVGQSGAAPILHGYIDFAEGLLALYSQNPADACAHLERAVGVFANDGDLFQVFAVTILGLAYDLRQDTQRAIGCYEDALAITEARGESVFKSYVLGSLALALWRKGDTVRATRLFGEVLQVSRTLNDRLNASMCLQALAWVAAKEQVAERAVVLTAAAEELARSVGSPPVLFPDLLVYQEECERQIRQMMSEKSYAAARREGAALSFEAAIAYALGQPASPQISAAGSKLTKREREVAELIAEGLTNKEIAARLVISPRTTDGHVEHILVKLEFTSRSQIAAWIAASRT